jgi:hypothetical protein
VSNPPAGEVAARLERSLEESLARMRLAFVESKAITNPRDSAGEMRWFDEPERPREIIAAATRRAIGVMGIRAVQAGAVTDGIVRDLPPDDPIAADFTRAAPLRQLARELGESMAALAHRYALSMARGPLPAETIQAIDRELQLTP